MASPSLHGCPRSRAEKRARKDRVTAGLAPADTAGECAAVEKNVAVTPRGPHNRAKYDAEIGEK